MRKKIFYILISFWYAINFSNICYDLLDFNYINRLNWIVFLIFFGDLTRPYLESIHYYYWHNGDIDTLGILLFTTGILRDVVTTALCSSVPFLTEGQSETSMQYTRISPPALIWSTSDLSPLVLGKISLLCLSFDPSFSEPRCNINIAILILQYPQYHIS